MNQELDRFESLYALFDKSVPALLATNIANIRYLLNRPTLFDPDFGGFMLMKKGVAILFVDSRYVAKASAANLGCDIRQLTGSPWGIAASAMIEFEIKRVGFEANNLSVAQWEALKEKTKAELVPLKSFVEEERLIKGEKEIENLSRAAAISDNVFSEVLKVIQPGLRETDVAMEIDYRMKKAGADGSSFDTIVASGPHSAFPHAGAEDRLLQLGDFIKMDFGAVYSGYHADMTRTIVMGPASKRQRQVYAGVKEAQQLVLDKLKVGMTGAEADAVAREYFLAIGMADKFSHNLGHGLGLEVHEGPSLGPKNKKPLEKNMVFTVEPGLYFEGFGGVRIEDMVVMRENGVEVLTNSSKELIEIG